MYDTSVGNSATGVSSMCPCQVIASHLKIAYLLMKFHLRVPASQSSNQLQWRWINSL